MESLRLFDWFLINHSHPLSLGIWSVEAKLVSSHREGEWLLGRPLSMFATRYLFPSRLLGKCAICQTLTGGGATGKRTYIILIMELTGYCGSSKYHSGK